MPEQNNRMIGTPRETYWAALLGCGRTKRGLITLVKTTQPNYLGVGVVPQRSEEGNLPVGEPTPTDGGVVEWYPDNITKRFG